MIGKSCGLRWRRFISSSSPVLERKVATRPTNPLLTSRIFFRNLPCWQRKAEKRHRKGHVCTFYFRGSVYFHNSYIHLTSYLHWFKCGSGLGSRFLPQCGFRAGSGLREPNQCRSMRIRILVRLCRHKKFDFDWKNINLCG